MYMNLVTGHEALFSPPLPLPLKIIRSNDDQNFKAEGLFGDYRNAESYGSIQSYRPHTGVDFRVTEGTPVFAVRNGWVVQIHDINSDSNNRRVIIRHIKEGAHGFVTRYLHVRNVSVAEGDFVKSGTKIAEVSKVDGFGVHLHFEVHFMLADDPNNPPNWYWEQTETVNPIPLLYHWEKIYYERIRGDFFSTDDPKALDEIAVMRYSGTPIFRAIKNGVYYFLPLPYLDAGEEEIVRTLREAYFQGSEVRIASRDSEFFKLTVSGKEYKLITAVRVKREGGQAKNN